MNENYYRLLHGEYNIMRPSLTIDFLNLEEITMAVPKKKTSKSKRNMRRAHDALKPINVIMDQDSGEYRLPHQMDKSTGSYNGRQVVTAKEDDSEEDE